MPGKLPIIYYCTQLLLGRASPLCDLRGINHSVGPFPRFFFQDAFSIGCEINALQTAMECTRPPLKEDSWLLLRLSVVVKSILGHWAVVSHALGITPYPLFYNSSLTRVILPIAMFPIENSDICSLFQQRWWLLKETYTEINAGSRYSLHLH